MDTKAYPNYNYYMPTQPPRDVVKWVQAVREMYYQIHKGSNWQQALQNISKDFDTMEKLDFINWLKFYEEGAQNKYKMAQVSLWGDQNSLGYYLPMSNTKKPDMQPLVDMTAVRNSENHPDMIQEEKRQIIEKQRQKIISRLDAAEKLLRSSNGQQLMGPELEAIMDALYQLKKKIHLVNKISTSVRLYQDMIIREANILNGKGHRQGSSILIKIAQEVPSAAEAPNPALVDGGQAGTIPGQSVGEVPPNNNPPAQISVDVSQQGAPPETAPNTIPPEPLSPGMQEFLDGLDVSKTPMGVDEVNEADEDFVVEAQVSTTGLPSEPVEEVVEKAPAPVVMDVDRVDQKFNQALDGITIVDIVNKLEELAKIFKTRAIPRELAMVDMMLDKLGLASFFPALSEAHNKSLESNNYMQTRIDDILSKLRGALETKDIDLKNDDVIANPLSQKLEQADEKERAKKQMRKELEEHNLEAKVAPKTEPQVEMQQDLSQPTKVEAPITTTTAPIPPPTV